MLKASETDKFDILISQAMEINNSNKKEADMIEARVESNESFDKESNRVKSIRDKG